MENEFGWIGPVTNLATAGGFAALVWYLVIKHIPAIENRHLEERNGWMEYARKRDDAFEKLMKEHLTIAKDLHTSINSVDQKIDELIRRHEG